MYRKTEGKLVSAFDACSTNPAIVARESNVAGLAGIAAVRTHADASELLGIGLDSRVLVCGTEGATDPDPYADILAGGFAWAAVSSPPP